MFSKEDPLLKHLDANTPSVKTKIFDTWLIIKDDHGVSSSSSEELKDFSVSIAQNYKEQPIIILIDEILQPHKMLKSLSEPSDSFPASVRIIAVVNPILSSGLPTLPESVLQIKLTTPYRSTIAITSLARFLAKSWEGLDVPEGEFGSDVGGKKPIAFDDGADKEKLKTALRRSLEQLGDDAALLYSSLLSSSILEICESHGKEKGGPWECYEAQDFYGWEAERVVAVTSGGGDILEMATRAKRELILILAEEEEEMFYEETQVAIKAAEDEGLVDLQVSESENNITIMIMIIK